MSVYVCACVGVCMVYVYVCGLCVVCVVCVVCVWCVCVVCVYVVPYCVRSTNQDTRLSDAVDQYHYPIHLLS